MQAKHINITTIASKYEAIGYYRLSLAKRLFAINGSQQSKCTSISHSCTQTSEYTLVQLIHLL